MTTSFRRLVIQPDMEQNDPDREFRLFLFTDGSIKVEICYAISDPNIEGDDPKHQEVSLTPTEVSELINELNQNWVQAIHLHSQTETLGYGKNYLPTAEFTNE